MAQSPFQNVNISNQPAFDKSIFNFVDSLVHDKSQNSIFNYIDDPTVMGFNFVIDFNDSNNPLFYRKSDAESAYQYLININELDRAASLYDFTIRMQDIIFRFPWYFQSLSGMKDIYKMDPTLGLRTKDRVLEIKTLESIDLRVANMIDKYMKAYFDEKWYREMIPQNLRKFSCWIILSEIRNFKSYFSAINGTNFKPATGNMDDAVNFVPAAGSIKKGYSIRSINSLFNCYVYRLNNCEFDFSSSNDWMGEIDQKGKQEFASNSFKIKVGRIEEMHKMNFGEMTYAADNATSNYRKTIFGVPDEVGSITLPDILKIEDTVSGNSWLQQTIDAIKATPAYASLSASLTPSGIEDKIRMLAMNQIRDITQSLVGTNNVFGHKGTIQDITNQITSFNFTDAINNLLNPVENNRSGPIRQNVFGHSTDVGRNDQPTQTGQNVFNSNTDPLNNRPLEKSLGKIVSVLDKDTPSLFNAYLGNVFGYRPVASTLNNGLTAAIQSAGTGNNSVT